MGLAQVSTGIRASRPGALDVLVRDQPQDGEWPAGGTSVAGTARAALDHTVPPCVRFLCGKLDGPDGKSTSVDLDPRPGIGAEVEVPGGCGVSIVVRRDHHHRVPVRQEPEDDGPFAPGAAAEGGEQQGLDLPGLGEAPFVRR